MVPAVSASARNASCILYSYTTNGLCKNIITTLNVFGDKSTIKYGETETQALLSYFKIFQISEKCNPIIRDLYCRYHFPPCDTTLEKPRKRRICRRSCEYLINVPCKKEMILVKEAAKTAPYFDHRMINCSTYPVANGGDPPECYQSSLLPGT